MNDKTCKWTQGFSGGWSVGCKEHLNLSAAIKISDFQFCPFCKKKIEAKEFELG